MSIILSTFASPSSFTACGRMRSSAEKIETADVLNREQTGWTFKKIAQPKFLKSGIGGQNCIT